MKLLVILTFISGLAFGQSKTRDFEITTSIAAVEYTKKVQSITSEMDKVDLKFMRKHFYIPYYLPEEFVNQKYVSETVVVWHDENKKDDYTANWTNTYKYDSLSRITEYSYSGCISCSNMPYWYKVTYNSKNQITLLKNIIKSNNDFFEIRYDANGEITELKSCAPDGKTKKIIKTLE